MTFFNLLGDLLFVLLCSGELEYNQAFYDRLHSWILYITKEVMGVEDVRNNVLRYFLRNVIPQHNVEYGPTFSIGIPKEKLYKYLDTVISSINNNEDKIILFTCNNSYGPIPKKMANLLKRIIKHL